MVSLTTFLALRTKLWLVWVEVITSDTLTCMPDKLSLRSWMSLQETGNSFQWWKISKGISAKRGRVHGACQLVTAAL